MIVIHPAWIRRAGGGDIVHYFDSRGFDLSNIPGSRFIAVDPKPALVAEGTPIKQGDFRAVNFFRGNR